MDRATDVRRMTDHERYQLLVGERLARDNAIVYQAGSRILHGDSLEEALGVAVRALATANARLLRDMESLLANARSPVNWGARGE